MVKPLIGINPYYFYHNSSWWNGTKENYYNAVWLGGGVPMTIHHSANESFVDEIIQHIDGLLMVGGPDLPIQTYSGNQPELLDDDVMHQNRESFDRAIFKSALKLNKPILAICAGFQHINIIYGGTLYEDIPTQVERNVFHGDFNGDWAEHTVHLEEGSLISRVMGHNDPIVASTHHQGIRKLGKGLQSVGRASDGLIEAVEDTENPEAFIAVQWHPELSTDTSNHLNLFKWLTLKSLERKNT
ncbi:MAG: gamma-glutamyl-gamma-aminobutyrate hydrolase family protein [Candidatus Marinimicrobia bacterium]|nr:gamma-glutamyl-gamma-aminobutyrate hydrolase family protein [Candidatus Neomarinimicrobiota bacterium]